jgi:Family of unknown function (DUF6282)
MAALVLKNHFFTTALRARAAEQHVPGLRLIGSIVLSQPMGGVNPWAVQAAAEAGAGVVWMPTFQAENQVSHEARPGAVRHTAQLAVDGLDAVVRVFDAEGRPTAATEAVLEIAREPRADYTNISPLPTWRGQMGNRPRSSWSRSVHTCRSPSSVGS